jgi:Carboxypeptidase regulatory-like domain
VWNAAHRFKQVGEMGSRGVALFLMSSRVVPPVAAQSTYTAQLTGVVGDSSGAAIPGAKVTLTDEGTNAAVTHDTNGQGIYVFTGVRPSTYTIRVDAANLAPQERKGLILAVAQQATLDFTLSPKGVSETITVTGQAPLLDIGSATLGTDVTNEYVKDIPLINRSMFGLVFLAGGVTETTGSVPLGTKLYIRVNWKDVQKRPGSLEPNECGAFRLRWQSNTASALDFA